MKKILTKRQIRKKETILKRKQERKIERDFKRIEKQQYKDFIKKIKERDNYTCQISGKSFKNASPHALHVAHIFSKENYPEFMLEPMNVLCLSFYNHKNSPLSPHLDGFAFVQWLKVNKPEQYKWCIDKINEIGVVIK